MAVHQGEAGNQEEQDEEVEDEETAPGLAVREKQPSTAQLLSSVVELQGVIMKMQEMQEALIAEKEMKKSWPEIEFDTPRYQHEGDALREIAAELAPLSKIPNLSNIGVAKVHERIKERRAAMVYVWSHEGWATAAHIADISGTFLWSMELA